MQSTSVLNNVANVDLQSMDKSEVSKSLFGQINWDQILRSGVFLESRAHQLLENSQVNLAVIIDNIQDAKEFVNILIVLADQCKNDLTVQQYVFTRVEQILGLCTDFADIDSEVFGSKNAHLFTSDGINLYDAPFIKAINNSDNYLQKSASIGLASLFSKCHGNIDALVTWINSKLTSNSTSVCEMALPTLIILVRSTEARQVFIASSGVNYVVAQLKRIGMTGNAQHIYDLCFILWTLTLSAIDNDVKAFLTAGTISVLVDFLASSPSRKVSRVVVAALRNLGNMKHDDILTEMFSSNLEKVLLNVMQSTTCKESSDPEFDLDIHQLNEIMLKNHRDLSTLERWVSEIHSNALRWGVVHTEAFWRENAKNLEANEFSLLKKLIELLHSTDSVIVSIALYDIGEFTRFYPNGRAIVSHLKGKDLVMEKIGDTDPEVQRYALQCISKIMVTNWEFMK